MVKFVDDRTYKLFAKRIREIDKENYDVFCSNIENKNECEDDVK